MGILGAVWNIARNEWKGVISGIMIGVVANSVFQAGTSRIDDIAYRDEAFTELLERLSTAQQLSVTAFNPKIVFDNVQRMNDDTKSATGNPKFEGKRFANLIYDLQHLSRDKHMFDLLERLKYIDQDIPINEQYETSDARESAEKINGELSDFYCCISLATGQGDAPYCKLPERDLVPRWCLYDRGDLFVVPLGNSSRPSLLSRLSNPLN